MPFKTILLQQHDLFWSETGYTNRKTNDGTMLITGNKLKGRGRKLWGFADVSQKQKVFGSWSMTEYKKLYFL